MAESVFLSRVEQPEAPFARRARGWWGGHDLRHRGRASRRLYIATCDVRRSIGAGADGSDPARHVILQSDGQPA